MPVRMASCENKVRERQSAANERVKRILWWLVKVKNLRPQVKWFAIGRETTRKFVSGKDHRVTNVCNKLHRL
jgi:hypothetical protein